jgi:hypothetical protein
MSSAQAARTGKASSKRAMRDERRQKRGGGRIQHQQGRAGDDDADKVALEDLIGREPTPAFAAQVGRDVSTIQQRRLKLIRTAWKRQDIP